MNRRKFLKDTMPHVDYCNEKQQDIAEVLDKCIEDGLSYDPLNFNMDHFDFDDLYDLTSNILHDVGAYTRYLRYADDYIFTNLEELITDNLKYSAIDISSSIITYDDIYVLTWNVIHDILKEDHVWYTDESWDRVNLMKFF